MSEQPNPADFVVNEREGEFYARFRVQGEILMPIQAQSLEEAKAAAQSMSEDEQFGLELDEVTFLDTDHVYKAPRMFYVMRNDQKMQVSHLNPGDLPRQPDERGF